MKYDALNQIISENKPYNMRLCTFTKFNFKRNYMRFVEVADISRGDFEGELE